MPKKPVLRYLFEAEYLDGRIYKQNPQDASVKYPPVVDENGDLQGKSCMSDIQEDVDNHLIKSFSLIGKGHRITVDLQTGLFTIDRLEALLESIQLPAMPRFFNLKYYRQVTVDLGVDMNINSGEILSVDDSSDLFIEYFIGWECEISGKIYQQRLGVA